MNETYCSPCDLGWYVSLLFIKPSEDSQLHHDDVNFRCRWPTEDRKGCFDLSVAHLKYMRWSSLYSMVPAIFAVIGIIATVSVIVIYAM